MTLPGQATEPSPIKVIKNYVPFADRLPLFKALVEGPWHTLKIRGKDTKRKNIVFYEGDPVAAYAYAKKATDKDRPIPYAEGPAELRALRQRLQDDYGFSFSACYINSYRDEGTGIGWHNDAEEVGSRIPVRMVCLGGTRTFSIWKVRHDKDGRIPKTKFADWEELTESGDLVEMPVGFHEEDAYRHAVLVQKKYAAARLSLTFRSPDLSPSGPWAQTQGLAPSSYQPDFLRPAEAQDLLAATGPRVFCCKAGHEPPPDAVYVGCRTVRGQKRDGTIFGNAVDPLKVRRKGSNSWIATTAEAFRIYALDRLNDPAFRSEAEKLRGKDLLCWCVQDGPKRAKFCHARVWLELINGNHGGAGQ